MSKRRLIHFETLDDVLQDAESLLRDGYRRAGNWSLGNVCDHLGNGLTYSRDGFPTMKPWLFRRVARLLFLRRIVARKVTHLRFPAPIPTAFEGTDEEGFRRLAAGIERFRRGGDVFAAHPVLDVLTPDQWLQLQLWHCEHHFSFLLPLSSEAGAHRVVEGAE